MRLIKFRAWQKTHEYMTDDLAMVHNVFYYDDPQDGIRIDDDWVLMQFTGLKDKNGVEIFESDVLLTEEDSVLHDVYWNDDCARFEVKERNGDVNDLEFSDIYVVVGNAFQHPNLLEGDNE